METCKGCTAGPSGIQGHDDLFTYRMAGKRLQFKCVACELLWVRDYKGGGGFEWARSTDEFAGLAPPGLRRE